MCCHLDSGADYVHSVNSLSLPLLLSFCCQFLCSTRVVLAAAAAVAAEAL